MPESEVLIVGGGAAGLAAAISAARLGAAVTILERDARVGRKILASGNGRCNLTNLSATPSAYNHPGFVEPVLNAYSCDVIRSFFDDLGLLTVPDDEGRVYPATNAAGSVLDVMRLECSHLGVDVRHGFDAASITGRHSSGGFEALSQDGDGACADTVVVTTGGGQLLVTMGHKMIDRVPVLGPLKTDTDPIRGLSGVRVRCSATLFPWADGDAVGEDAIATERGELLFRDYGVSGIMVFDLSRYIEPDCVLSIDLFPDVSPQQMRVMVAERCENLSWRTAETFFSGMLHDRVARAVLRVAGVGLDIPAGELPQVRLAEVLKDFRLRVVGVGDASQAQVTRGGASVEEFDAGTMASKLADGVFAAGEVLDVDGRSGGYNLHWAWASGIVAGEEAARKATAHAAGCDADTGDSA